MCAGKEQANLKIIKIKIKIKITRKKFKRNILNS